jgi:hypothetical protein
MLPVRRTCAAILCAAMLSGAAMPSLAQEATPVSGVAALEALNEVEVPPLPSALYAGTCTEMEADPAVVLADAEFKGGSFAAGGMVAADGDGAMTASAMAIPVAVGTTNVPLSIKDIVSGGHALSVSDPSDAAKSIACGNIGGRADRKGNLFIGIEPMNDSGISGVAWLHEQDGETTVTVMLTRPFFVQQATGMFAATPTP